MKISMNNPIASKNNKIENKNKAFENTAKTNRANTDKITFSSDAQKYADYTDVQALQSQISNTLDSPVSAEKLETLKQTIALNNYTVSSEKIANAILGYTKK